MTLRNLADLDAEVVPLPSAFRAYDLQEFIDQPFPPREQLLPPWLPVKGLAMVFAPRGMGKTFFSLNVGYAVASGGSFLKWTAAKPRRVILLDGEMTGAQLQERLAEIIEKSPGEPQPGYFRLIPFDTFIDGATPDLSTVEGQRLIEPHLTDADLVIVDNLSTLCRSGKENEAESWGQIQHWALEQRKKGRSVLFVHHAGKGGEQRGTSRREDVLDTVIRLANPEDYEPSDGARFVVSFTKSRGLMPPVGDSMMAKAKNKQVAKAAPKREPSKREQRAIAAARQTREARPARAQYIEAESAEGAYRVDSPHSDADGLGALVCETFGTTSDAFVGAALLHLTNASAVGGAPSIEGLNASLALVAAIAPQNELEAALASQMATTHRLSCDMLLRTKNAPSVEAMREYGNLATKLSRTFTAQMKALSDWRRGGEQVVRHVHVYEGGQAVVAETVNVRGQGNENGAFNPHAQGALVAPMFGQDPAGHPVPVPGDEGPDPVPDARGKDARGRRA